MKYDFDIYDEISDGDSWASGYVTPQSFADATKDLNGGDELTIRFNSVGGSVTGGIAIANKVRELSKNGVKTTAVVEGICASIATVIMCACDKVIMNSSAFVMIHNCWAVVQGDADELRKQADVMEKMNEAILSFYRTKFDLTDDELKAYMDAETWFSGSEASDFKFNCEVVETDSELKLAAKFDPTKFNKLPERILEMMNKKQAVAEQNTDDEKKSDNPDEKVEETVEEETAVEEPEEEEEEKQTETESVEEETSTSEEETVEEEKPVEEKEETDDEDKDKTIEQLKARIAELEKELEEYKKPDSETVSKDECEKRVSGMQASMQRQINAHIDQINDFKNQLDAKDKELISAKAEITRLSENVEAATKSNSELLDKVSALTKDVEDKQNALAMLNAGVNAPAEPPTDWRNLKGQEFFDFVKKHPEICHTNR